LLSRSFDTDKDRIINFCNRLNESPDNYILVIFPEGTTYADTTIKKSHEYTDKNNMERFKNVLCPKTRGTELILQHLKVDLVLDMTIIYNDYHMHYGTEKGLPFAYPQGLLKGEYPQRTTFLIRDVTNNLLKYQIIKKSCHKYES